MKRFKQLIFLYLCVMILFTTTGCKSSQENKVYFKEIDTPVIQSLDSTAHTDSTKEQPFVEDEAEQQQIESEPEPVEREKIESEPESEEQRQNDAETTPEEQKKNDVEPAREEEGQEEPSSEEKNHRVTLLAVGDDLVHIEVVSSGKREDGTYQYDHLFDDLKIRFEAADIAVINQETVLGGSSFKYSGYPNFNSPTEIGDAIVKAGFDVVLHATNHSMDKGEKGIKATLDFWKQYPNIAVLGMYSSFEEQEEIKVIEKNGIKLAMLNYTYGLNGYTLPKGKEFLVNLLSKSQMKKDIKKAKELADFVVVFPHWGTEYVYEPDSNQKDLTKFFANQGVDLVIGAHPHVIEPVEWVKGEDDHQMLVYYSLGNYMSYQKKAPRMLGAIAEVTIERSDAGVEISKASVTPIVTHFDTTESYNFASYLLSDYTEELAKDHGVHRLEESSPFSKVFLCELSEKVLGDDREVIIK